MSVLFRGKTFRGSGSVDISPYKLICIYIYIYAIFYWCKKHKVYSWNHILLALKWKSQREQGGFECPCVNKAIIIQPPGSLSGFFLIPSKQVWALHISLSSRYSVWLQQIPPDAANWFIRLFCDWVLDGLLNCLTDRCTSWGLAIRCVSRNVKSVLVRRSR